MSQPPRDGEPTDPGRASGWGQPQQHGAGGPYPQSGGFPPPDDPTSRFPQPPPGALPGGGPSRDETRQFGPPPPPGRHPQGPGGGFPPPGAGFPPAPGGPYGGQPPGYPPQGPGGPGYGYGAPPPGGPGQPGDPGKRNLIIALVVGLVLLAGVAVALVLTLGGDEDRVATQPAGTTSSEADTSTSTSTSPSPSPSPSTSEAPPANAAADALLALLPADLSSCEEAGLAGDGDVAAASCGASVTQPGPQSATFYRYEDTATLDAVFAGDVAEAGVEPMPEGADCLTAEGYTTWNVGGVEGGEVACTIIDDEVVVAWSDREFGIEGVITAPGSTQEDLAALTTWWIDNSDYEG